MPHWVDYDTRTTYILKCKFLRATQFFNFIARLSDFIISRFFADSPLGNPKSIFSFRSIFMYQEIPWTLVNLLCVMQRGLIKSTKDLQWLFCICIHLETTRGLRTFGGSNEILVLHCFFTPRWLFDVFSRQITTAYVYAHASKKKGCNDT